MLDSVALGHQSLWNAEGERVGWLLALKPRAGLPSHASLPGGQHILRHLAQQLDGCSLPVLLAIESPELLALVLEQAVAPPADQLLELVVPQKTWASDHGAALLAAAHDRGLRLVASTPARQEPPSAVATHMWRTFYRLTEHDKLDPLPIAEPAATGPAADDDAPGGRSLYGGVTLRAKAEQLLHRPQTWALAGWPTLDVLKTSQHRTLQPMRRSVELALQALHDEVPIEALAYGITQDPLLSLRLLTHANSAALNLRDGVGTIHRAVMIIGHNALTEWLTNQLPHASVDPMLRPTMADVALRARLMKQLLDAGGEQELRRELQLCGLFSDIDTMLGQPMSSVLARLPLSDRIDSALLSKDGPYYAALEIARALGTLDLSRIEAITQRHGLLTGDVNRALLRTLVQPVGMLMGG